MVEFYLARRFSVDAHAPPADNAVLPAAFVGHCPGEAQPAALVEGGALDDIRRAGFGSRADTIEAWYRGELVLAGAADELFHLPIPIRSSQQFREVFPDVDGTGTAYTSTLAGQAAWLPRAVDDFFSNGGKKLWVVRVREEEGTAEFGLGASQNPADIERLRGLGVALAIDEVGLLAMPDLERLLVPADQQYPDTPVLTADPVFTPCPGRIASDPPPSPQRVLTPENTSLEARLRTSEAGSETPTLSYALDSAPSNGTLAIDASTGDYTYTPDADFNGTDSFTVAVTDTEANVSTVAVKVVVSAAQRPMMIRSLLYLLNKTRPDVTCLYTLPLGEEVQRAGPGLSVDSIKAIAKVRSSSEGPALRRLQFLFPYLRGVDGHIHSAVGVVAGKQAAVAERHGPWRSIAGRRLESAARPFPALTRQQELKLREEPGLSILTVQDGRTLLTDERLCVPALHPGDYNNTAAQRRALAGYRSAEISRFIGYLLRQLRDLGDAMIFQVDPRDPRPGILLNAYFDRLYRRGALRGARATDAYQVRRMPAGDSVMRFDIEIAPAFPIDHVRLAFSQDGERWQASTADG